MQFPYGPLAPDLGENTPGAMMVADGVIPLQDGYGPFPALTVATSATALSGAPRGMFSYQNSLGSWGLAAGTSSTIELLQSDYTWTSIDSGLSITTGDDWSFLRFGKYLLYTNTTQGMRQYDVDGGGAASAVSAAKAPRVIWECGNIVFGGDCLNSAGSRDNRLIRSTAMSDHTNWTTSGADYQGLETGGALVWGGKLSDTQALVLQEQGVKLIQVGNAGSALWGIQSVSEGFGSVGARSVVSFDGAVYWLATDGFRRFTMANGIERIGAGAIDQYFLGLVDQANLALVQGTVDPFRKSVLWRWKRSSASDTVTTTDIIGYNWQFNRWFTLTVSTSYIMFGATSAVTWDSFTGTWDSVDITWDSRALAGGQPLLGAMNSAYKFGYFAGGNLAATLETGLVNSPTTALLNWCDPIDDSADGTLQVGVTDALSTATTWKTGVSKTSSGRAPIRARGKNMAFRRNISASSTWSYAKGIDNLQASGGGPR